MLNNKKSGLLAENEAMDNEIMQKILPRIQGSGISVKELLIALLRILQETIAESVKTLYGVKWISISKIKNVYTKNLQKKYVI